MRKFLLLLVTWSALAVAQTPVTKVVSAHSEQRAVTATKTGLNYELLISLPENFASTQDHYPVPSELTPDPISSRIPRHIGDAASSGPYCVAASQIRSMILSASSA